jgi:hypothetical protein
MLYIFNWTYICLMRAQNIFVSLTAHIIFFLFPGFLEMSVDCVTRFPTSLLAHSACYDVSKFFKKILCSIHKN